MIHIVKNKTDVKRIINQSIKELNEEGIPIRLGSYNLKRKYPCIIMPFTVDNRGITSNDKADLLIYFYPLTNRITKEFFEAIKQKVCK